MRSIRELLCLLDHQSIIQQDLVDRALILAHLLSLRMLRGVDGLNLVIVLRLFGILVLPTITVSTLLLTVFGLDFLRTGIACTLDPEVRLPAPLALCLLSSHSLLFVAALHFLFLHHTFIFLASIDSASRTLLGVHYAAL